MEIIQNNKPDQRSATAEDGFLLVIDTIPGFVWSASPACAEKTLDNDARLMYYANVYSLRVIL
jgi:hypothetical protein